MLFGSRLQLRGGYSEMLMFCCRGSGGGGGVAIVIARSKKSRCEKRL